MNLCPCRVQPARHLIDHREDITAELHQVCHQTDGARFQGRSFPPRWVAAPPRRQWSSTSGRRCRPVSLSSPDERAVVVARHATWLISLRLSSFDLFFFLSDLRPLTGKGEVAKLFAKHFKLAEHVSPVSCVIESTMQCSLSPWLTHAIIKCKYCRETRFALGAGTPDRIQKLLDAGETIFPE